MGAPERTVRHLRLRADSETNVRSAALKLEDALRCASLPDAGARVLLVRRLDLGRMAAGASPQTLSLLLERRVAAAGGTWVQGADPGAERADFVFFRDALEARGELALRLARAAPCTAWYWPLAVPEFKPLEGVQENLRRIACALAALPEAPVAVPVWIARLTAAGVAPVLARAIGPSEAAMLLRAAHLRVADAAPRSRMIRMASPELPQLVSGAQDAGYAEGSPRSELAPAFTALPSWLQILARAGGVVPPVSSVRPVAPAANAAPVPGAALAVHAVPAARTAPAASAAPVAADAAPTQTGNEQARQNDGDVEKPPAIVARDTAAKDVHESPIPEQIHADAAHFPGQPDRITTGAVPGSRLSGRPFLDAAESAYGGLLFLLPVLQRLGYTAWAEALPEGAAAQVVRRLLALVLRRLDAPSDDPAWLLAGISSQDDAGAIEVDAQARLWLSACRRWLRRVARIGVASLVIRSAAIGLTATHADIYFRLSDADMRVRRAGLDFDPGWVPWLGRVVAFHYSDQLAPVPVPGGARNVG